MTPPQETARDALATPAWVRRPTNLARAVTAELVERIVRGAHPAGTALPPEPILCETFSVSRTVVREAVKILQEKGLVQVRQGAGTMITPQSQWDMLDELVLAATIAEDNDLTILDDLVVTRRLLESDMANVAARVADQLTIDRLRAQVDRMDELVDDHVTYHDHDRAFHDTVMHASGNRIARGVVRALESQVVNTARYMGRTERSLCVASNRGHRRIYERIAAHDPEGAAEAMFTHITEAWLVRRGDPGEPIRLQR
ncbi:FadR/GntR family transcriptional regulator [Micromonospora endophytica]|uniref:GntR family transcriptional regulator n=1 Tax=Micromonospora endophytica TaxID=515350 RepID=A0A2W2D3G6_9ACTN|nr:FadR/GntR family transcriptional regulator [Micromonospora endophytica]PZF95139.1 GntR family transcriptional regulator [Micromonospora endophytica]RIW43886.1 FadR family transcriptional regulator [Micromonospora endophytica]BCJ56937.1 GntR family transcriptional regulator [Micromonospora endophytica]